MAEARIRLLTRADDAGSCHSANRAIVETIEQGCVRNVSVMAVGPEVEEAAEMLRRLPRVCLGLHATINAEWDDVKWGPVLPPGRVPSLVDADGDLLATPALTHERPADPDEVLAELEAQLRRLRDLGLRVQYVDTHMCFDWLPGVSARLDGLAGHEGLLRPGARIAPLPPLGREVGGAGDPGEALVARLKAAAPGTYLVVGHPGYDEADMRQFRHAGLGAGEVARERDRERRQFTSPAVLEYARAGGVEFVRYTDVLR